jgi:uridine kinase
MRDNYPLIVEGAFLGNPALLELYGAIIFIQTDDNLRFTRLVKRDGHKRTYNELMDRWQITGQSETAYYTMLFNTYPERIYIVDSDFDFVS